jgi:catechol 2,3-dioxygenase-like lactoylglutathione lyase family enzyme
MFYGVSHLDIPVTDLDRARSFWRDVIGCTEVKQGEGFADLDSGSIRLRLLQVARVEHPVSVRVAVRDVAEAYAALVQAGARPLYEAMRTPALELMACVADPDGHSIVLWRELTEDEYDFVPDLPKEGEWRAEAEELLVKLLAHVPALFRALARRKVTRNVEYLASTDHSPVTREHVIRGYILSSARITRYRLVEPLKRCGIDPERYRAEFETD